MSDKIKYEEATSPKGIAIYPHVNEPEVKFNANGVYDIKLALDGSAADTKALLSQIDRIFDANVVEALETVKADIAKAGKARPLNKTPGIDTNKLPGEIAPKVADKPYQMELNDQGEPTGRVVIKAKMNAQYTAKKGPNAGQVVKVRPELFDSKGKPVDPKAVKVWGGSECRIRMSLVPFFTGIGAGVSLQLKAVQIVKLSNGRDATAYGFSEEEGGFEQQDSGPVAETPAQAPVASGDAAAKGNF